MSHFYVLCLPFSGLFLQVQDISNNSSNSAFGCRCQSSGNASSRTCGSGLSGVYPSRQRQALEPGLKK